MSSLDGSPDDIVHMAVALLSGSTLAAGQSMQSTCVYWLSAYTSVQFTGFVVIIIIIASPKEVMFSLVFVC